MRLDLESTSGFLGQGRTPYENAGCSELSLWTEVMSIVPRRSFYFAFVGDKMGQISSQCPSSQGIFRDH